VKNPSSGPFCLRVRKASPTFLTFHGGGLDLQFPDARGRNRPKLLRNGTRKARYWLHNEIRHWCRGQEDVQCRLVTSLRYGLLEQGRGRGSSDTVSSMLSTSLSQAMDWAEKKAPRSGRMFCRQCRDGLKSVVRVRSRRAPEKGHPLKDQYVNCARLFEG